MNFEKLNFFFTVVTKWQFFFNEINRFSFNFSAEMYRICTKNKDSFKIPLKVLILNFIRMDKIHLYSRYIEKKECFRTLFIVKTDLYFTQIVGYWRTSIKNIRNLSCRYMTSKFCYKNYIIPRKCQICCKSQISKCLYILFNS